ncbi:alpha/beta hydrolase [Abyssalbus ytuae]|uniref:Alpha/beta hydrolase n=1 Tax=Abyssalbus ytuae TaxID=2926907 RepID=A0A9E6ZTM0_9FLAO|nr:alpha/beta hydrolase [Abyssalbus ytuae]UOB17578.1 alpha/beta hydrolase [Abyssalbus ytuae]
MKFFLLFILLFISEFIFSQSDETIYLWPDKVPNEIKAKSPPVQTPDTSRGVIRITKITNPLLSIYRPADSINNRSAIIIAPGGGYNYLAINIEGSEIANWLNSLGFTAFVLQYRVPGNRLGALNDIQRAIRIVRSKSADFNLSPNKIGVMGFSAGGNLSLLACANFKNSSYASTDLTDSINCRPDFGVLIYPAFKKNEANPKIHFNRNMPPLFIFGTFDDFLAEGFFELGNQLKETKTSVQMHLYEAGGHGYGLRNKNPAAKVWPDLFSNWIKTTLHLK